MIQKFNVYIFINKSYEKCAILSVSDEGFELEYLASYLKGNNIIDIDPHNLIAYPKVYKSESLFTAILDSAPDYWGQQLLNKKFKVEQLNDLEYVLANNIEHVGALAFSSIDSEHPMQLTPNGWQPHTEKKVKLKQIIDQTELMINNADKNKLKELFDAGPTLGGGKPKVSLIIDDTFFLAKYGTSLDSLPEQQIEYAVMKMAKDLKLNVPQIKMSEQDNKTVFFIERFDREIINNQIKRFHFVSALSLCDWHVFGHQEWSYPLFAQYIRKTGSNEKEIKEDLRELYRRIAFNIAVNNDDDHPRNHGLLYKDSKWRLSPLYDVFPKATQTNSFTSAMSTGVYQREASKRNLLSACEFFSLKESEASLIIDEINEFISENWRKYFKESGLNSKVIKLYENAFSLKE